MSFTVGQLAKLAGLTVRALHHYDAIGLLVPSKRSDSGYRLYAQDDVLRLYRIQGLRRLGLSLAEVQAVLARDGARIPEMIAQQLAELDSQIEHATALRSRLLQLRERLAHGNDPSPDDWLAAVELFSHYDKYCSPEELSRLMVPASDGEDEWTALVADARAAMDRQLAPQSAEARALGDRWTRLVMRRVDGDIDLALKIKQAYLRDPSFQASFQAVRGMDAAMVDYLWQAIRHSHLLLWEKYLPPHQAQQLYLEDDQRREWIRVATAMRREMEKQSRPDSAGVQGLLDEWDSLFDEFTGQDAVLKGKVLQALRSDADLKKRWLLDDELHAFVQRAREAGSG